MEFGNSTMLESSSEDILAVKTIVPNSRNELETEGDFFLVSQAQSEQYSEENVEQTSTLYKQETLAWTQLCRLCANVNDQMIPIYEGEGVQHDLSNKILKYLPIHISKTDTLPLQLCFHCANTLLAWHELCIGCLNAEKRLLEMQDTLQNKYQYCNPTPSDNSEIAATAMTSNTIDSQPEQQVNIGNGAEENLSNRSCGVRTPFKVSLDTQNAFWKPYRKRCQSRTMRNLKKSKALTAEDCDSVWITDTVLDQPLAVSEQLENNDPMRFSAKEKHVAAQQSVKDIESYQTMQEEKIPMDEILKNSPYSSGDEKNDDSCEISKVAHEEELFRCVECGKCFKLKDSFHRHMRIHKDERPFTCHICGKQFRDSGGLTRHLKDVHAKLKNFMCDLCGRSFASKATREDHRRTHTGERPYVCDSCGKTFKSKASLYIHSKLHTDEFPHACSYCGKQFRRRQEVLAHVTTHTGEKNHTCEICGKKFRVKSELARHKLIHSEDKPFVCGKCGLAFRQKRYLNNHIKSRHSESS